MDKFSKRRLYMYNNFISKVHVFWFGFGFLYQQQNKEYERDHVII